MNSRSIKIGLASLVFLIITGSVIYYNYITLIPDIEDELEKCEGDTCFLIYGNVKENFSISADYLYNDTFTRIENREFHFINSYGTEYNMSISGVSLYSIFLKYGILNENATHIQFQASDGFKSPMLPISIMLEYPDQVLLVTHERGRLIKSKEVGGDGPIKGFASVPALESNQEIVEYFATNNNYGGTHVYNTVFSVKWVLSILVI